jgi:hypothetical protein
VALTATVFARRVLPALREMSGHASTFSTEGLALGKLLRLALQLWLTLCGPTWFYTGIACRPRLHDPRAVPPTPVSQFADVCVQPAATLATTVAAVDEVAAAPATAIAPNSVKSRLVPSLGAAPADATSTASSEGPVEDGFLRVHFLHETSRSTPLASPRARRPMLVQCFHGFGASSLSYRHVTRPLAARLAAVNLAPVKQVSKLDNEASTSAPLPERDNAKDPGATLATSAPQRAAVTVLTHDRCGFGLTSRPPLRLFGGRKESVQARAANPLSNPYSAAVDATVCL